MSQRTHMVRGDRLGEGRQSLGDPAPVLNSLNAVTWLFAWETAVQGRESGGNQGPRRSAAQRVAVESEKSLEGGRWKVGGERKGREEQGLQRELFAPGLGCLALPFPENRGLWFWPGEPHSPRRCLTAFTFELTLVSTSSHQNLSSYTTLTNAAVSFACPPWGGKHWNDHTLTG